MHVQVAAQEIFSINLKKMLNTSDVANNNLTLLLWVFYTYIKPRHISPR
jgi:hypothetical protein